MRLMRQGLMASGRSWVGICQRGAREPREGRRAHDGARREREVGARRAVGGLARGAEGAVTRQRAAPARGTRRERGGEGWWEGGPGMQAPGSAALA